MTSSVNCLFSIVLRHVTAHVTGLGSLGLQTRDAITWWLTPAEDKQVATLRRCVHYVDIYSPSYLLDIRCAVIDGSNNTKSAEASETRRVPKQDKQPNKGPVRNLPCLSFLSFFSIIPLLVLKRLTYFTFDFPLCRREIFRETDKVWPLAAVVQAVAVAQ